MNPKKAIIYVRVSTERQVERGASLDTQQQSCLEWCHRNGILPLQSFRDEGKSAKTLNRPEMVRMLNYINANSGTIDYLVIYQMDRLSRNTLDYYELVKALNGKNIEIRDTASSPDSGDSDELIRGINILIGDHETKLKARRVKENMARKASQGYRMHQAPYGLKNIRDFDGNPTLEPIEEISSKIAKVLSEFSLGTFTKSLIVNRCRELGLSQRNGKPMSIQYIDKLLKNPIYAGLERNTHTNGEFVDSAFAGIITKDTYFKNQDILAGRLNKQRGKYKVINPDYPLRGLIKCEECKSTLTASASTGRGGKKYPRYTCRSKDCSRGFVSPKVAHKLFVEKLNELAPSPNRMKLLKTLLVRKWSQLSTELNKERVALNGRQIKLSESKVKASEKFAADELEKEDYLELKSSLSSQLQEIENQLAEIGKTLSLKEKDIDYALGYLSSAAKIWEDASIDGRIMFQNMLFPEGIHYDLQKNEFGTAKLSSLYTLASMKKDPSKSEESLLVTPTGIEPVLPD